MNRSYLWISLAAVVVSFAGGFLLANALNRSEIAALRAASTRTAASSNDTGGDSSEMGLSNEELRAKIDEADANPTNFDFQKKMGLALYRYGSLKKDVGIIKEAIRLMTRANEIRKDKDLVLGLGNAYFDIGFFQKDNASLERARSLYLQALAGTPNDAEIRTDLGLTYFLYEPPDYDRSINEFLTALRSDPKHEKTLQFIIQAYVKKNKLGEAQKYLDELRKVSPENEALPGLASEIDGAKAK